MKKVILVADDSPSIRKFVSFSLTMQGFEVLSACDGMEALEKLPKSKIDLVITDLNMPNLDGIETIIKINEEIEYIPSFIMVTAYDKDELIEKLWSNGLNGMLDVIEEKVNASYKKGFKKGKKKATYDDGYKDGYNKGFFDGCSDSDTRYS